MGRGLWLHERLLGLKIGKASGPRGKRLRVVGDEIADVPSYDKFDQVDRESRLS